MAYQTFALKYRPRTFDEIVGQDHVATTLRNAVAEGRVAHGYLFAGPRGTGKTSTARVLAKALACERGPTPEPCCECEMCLAIDSGRALDLIEIDAASNRGIDDIRELREGVAYAPTQSRVKFYILDEAHMLTPAAANAFLKTLEEPPEFVHFVLATTEPHGILPTIRSRCQTFEFRPIAPALIVGALREIAGREDVEVEEEALGAIARAAGGAMRDAESIFDQAISFARGQVTLATVNAMLGVTDAELLASFADAVAAGDIQGVFEGMDAVVAGGKDIGQLVEDLSLYFRDLMRLSLGVSPPRWMQAPTAGRERMQAQAQAIGSRRLGETIEALGEAAVRLRETAQQSLLLEVTLAHLASAAEGAAQTAQAQPQATPAERPAPEPPVEEPEPEAVEPEPPAEQPKPEAVEPEPPEEPAEEAPKPAADEVAELPVALAGGEPTLEALVEHWPLVCRRLEDDGQLSVLAMVRDATPSDFDGETVALTFPSDYPWLRDRVAEGYTSRVSDAIEVVFGTRLGVRCVTEEGPAEAETGVEEAAGSSAQEQDKTVEALKLNFNGVEEQEGSL